jgi:hypothetical protein
MNEPPDPRMALEPTRRVRLRTVPVTVSSIKR